MRQRYIRIARTNASLRESLPHFYALKSNKIRKLRSFCAVL